ncbi:MAG: oligosaccharyl transferase, archaeosortase A system-associated [Halobacteriota archaeon]|nr:oligosaccharyl transferase, archaeosortase A system-associated [Halobacteriota archaeon]
MSGKSSKKSKVSEKNEELNKLYEKVSAYITIILLAIFSVVGLWVRTLNHANIFINGKVHFIDDGLPHMRFVENTVANFPHRIMFDPFTYYPHGTLTPGSFGPLFDQAIALIAIIAGGGDPSRYTIQTVGAYFPVVLGVLLIIPIYFIGKYLFNKVVGLVASGLYTIFPGTLLTRSALGFTDHHIAEVLLTTTMVLFLILGLKNIDDRKKIFIFGILSGFFFGLYMLVWNMGLVFLLILAIYLVVQFIVNHLQGEYQSNLTVLSHLTLGIPLLMILPSTIINKGFSSGILSYFHVLSFAGTMVAIQIIATISQEIDRRDMDRWYYPITLLALVAIAIGALYPTSIGNSLFGAIRFAFVPPSVAYRTVAEQMPFFYTYGGRFSLLPLWGNFAAFGFTFFPTFAFILYKTWRDRDPAKIFLCVWTLIFFALTYAHVRNAYYFVIPLILIGAYMLHGVMGWTGIYDERKRRRDRSTIVFAVITLIILIFVFITPTFTMAEAYVKSAGGFHNDWFETSEWMRYNTPEPDLDYYAFYERPDGDWQYGPNDYGVMSWWDYGHIIEYEGHRIPNANPYQQGIGGLRNGNITQGASTYFTAQNETEANKILDELGTKYVVIDLEMAIGKYHAIAKWATGGTSDFFDTYWWEKDQGTYEPIILYYPAYYQSMCSRLYNFGGKEVIPNNSTFVISYEERTDRSGYRFKAITSDMLFPSYDAAVEFIENQTTSNYRIVGTSQFNSPVPLEEIEHYKLIYQSNKTVAEFGDGSRLSYVEIFEYQP